jgi:Transposase DDE domain
MNHELLIIDIYCRIDASIKRILGRSLLRHGGFAPALSDAELITIEIIGEYHGICGDRAIWRFADGCLRHLFPKLTQYKTFTKQSGALAVLKTMIWHDLFPASSHIHIVDGVPMPLCRFVRSNRCKRLKDYATKGFCAAKGEYYYGLKGFALINERKEVVAFELNTPKTDERAMVESYFGSVSGLIIGDKGYISKVLKEKCAENGIELFTQKRNNMCQNKNIIQEKACKRIRKTIETVFSQLTEKFSLNKNTAISLAHYISQMTRKILSYNLTLGAK